MIGSKDSYALVTGASTGMGYEYAKLFAKDGKNVVVVARSGDKLEGLKKDLERAHGTKVKVLVKDLSDPKSPLEIFSELGRESVNVDVLVNNAGFAVGGKFSDSDWQKETEMLQVNIISLTQLTKLFLKGMLDKKSGKILNISSLAGFTPSSGASVYGGTKHYVLGFFMVFRLTRRSGRGPDAHHARGEAGCCRGLGRPQIIHSALQNGSQGVEMEFAFLDTAMLFNL
jgi:hypothetical protein